MTTVMLMMTTMMKLMTVVAVEVIMRIILVGEDNGEKDWEKKEYTDDKEASGTEKKKQRIEKKRPLERGA